MPEKLPTVETGEFVGLFGRFLTFTFKFRLMHNYIHIYSMCQHFRKCLTLMKGTLEIKVRKNLLEH